MDFELIIRTANASDLSRVLAAIGGTAATVSASTLTAAAGIPMPTPPAPVPSSDDDGPVNSAAPATDKAGFPWDERIHASTKSMNADGTWRKKKGVAADLVTSVEAELTARNAAAGSDPGPIPPHLVRTTPVPAPVPPQMPSAPVTPFPAGAPAMGAPPQMPSGPVPPMPANPNPAPQPAPAPVAPAGSVDYATFMTAYITPKLSQVDANGQPIIDAGYLARLTAEIAGTCNAPMNAITDISNYPQLINYAIQLMQRDGKL